MVKIIRGNQIRKIFIEDVLIELPNMGIVDSCLFIKRATIVYDRYGSVEYCNFRGENIVIKCDFPLRSPNDRTFQWNIFNKLIEDGEFYTKNNIRMGEKRKWLTV